ncbi:MAG: SWIM zinc finger family protein [Nitrososphaerota archaeon]|nr:SWIM zinc finger family protein [Nitrososphaerales archaeon]MDW8045572.1 SWIM zinc finger family protein [Nitrososphaerota archaeon]
MNKDLLEAYRAYGKKFDRALKLVENNCVKFHKFHPSGREVWTVIGSEGDQIVDPSIPYCSCRDFYFKALSSKSELCYHLLALQMAKVMEKYDEVKFYDEEYATFIKLLLHDLTKVRVK